MIFRKKSKFDKAFLYYFRLLLVAGIMFLLTLIDYYPVGSKEETIPFEYGELVLLSVSDVFPHVEGEGDTHVVETTEVTTEEAEIVVEPKGVLSPSSLTPNELESGLLNSLKDYSEVFIQAEKETGINAVFLSAVAALESGWAESNVSNTYNNLFGWTAKDGYKSFNSKEECILFVASRLKELYLTEGAVYFNGYEVEDINVCYNGRQHWEDNVNLIMKQIEYRIERSKIPC